jgi:hypothetical protein
MCVIIILEHLHLIVINDTFTLKLVGVLIFLVFPPTNIFIKKIKISNIWKIIYIFYIWTNNCY